MTKVSESGVLDSLGYFYGSITNFGFIPHRHEGKILGLATYAKIKRPLPKLRVNFQLIIKI